MVLVTEIKLDPFSPKAPGQMPGAKKPSPVDTAVAIEQPEWAGFALYTDRDFMDSHLPAGRQRGPKSKQSYFITGSGRG